MNVADPAPTATGASDAGRVRGRAPAHQSRTAVIAIPPPPAAGGLPSHRAAAAALAPRGPRVARRPQHVPNSGAEVRSEVVGVAHGAIACRGHRHHERDQTVPAVLSGHRHDGAIGDAGMLADSLGHRCHVHVGAADGDHVVTAAGQLNRAERRWHRRWRPAPACRGRPWRAARGSTAAARRCSPGQHRTAQQHLTHPSGPGRSIRMLTPGRPRPSYTHPERLGHAVRPHQPDARGGSLGRQARTGRATAHEHRVEARQRVRSTITGQEQQPQLGGHDRGARAKVGGLGRRQQRSGVGDEGRWIENHRHRRRATTPQGPQQCARASAASAGAVTGGTPRNQAEGPPWASSRTRAAPRICSAVSTTPRSPRGSAGGADDRGTGRRIDPWTGVTACRIVARTPAPA